MATTRYCGKLYQGLDEEKAYTFDWAAIGTPTAAAVSILDSNFVDKSASLLTGADSIVADTVITPVVADLSLGSYMLLCNATIGGLPWSAYMIIVAEY